MICVRSKWLFTLYTKQGKNIQRCKIPELSLEPYYESVFAKELIMELAFNIIHMPPWLNFEFNFNNEGTIVRYSLDDFITLIMIFRIYLRVRVLKKTIMTRWRNKRS